MDTKSSFEKGRIEALRDERIATQKKTFIKWINSFLVKVNGEVKDLFVDLSDGKLLIKLLELLSGEKVGRPNAGRLKVQKIENVNRCLKFLSSKIRLESIGAEDIVDGNQRLILGLIWTIILRFQIQDIQIEDESRETRSAKQALLLWCQRKTAGYAGVNVENFTYSWKNGLAFNALIHCHKPEVIDYDGLKHNTNIVNLNNAFTVAQTKLGIASLLDAEDVDVAKPDEKSIMTYVAAYYHYFAKMKTEKTGGKRIAKILEQLLEIEVLQHEYEDLISKLLQWIREKIVVLKNHHFPNSLEGIQEELESFKHFRIVEKPPKYVERSNIEGTLFSLQTKIRAINRTAYVPSDDKVLRNIERSWDEMEKAEHGRELALREELIRQEKLERLAQKFHRKSLLRESWIDDMISVLSDTLVPHLDIQMIEAATKRQEAISADVAAREERFTDLKKMATDLINGNYHSMEDVKRRGDDISVKWSRLHNLLENRQEMLNNMKDLISLFREIENIKSELNEAEVGLQSTDCGKHILGVENLLQKHSLIEVNIASQNKRLEVVNLQADRFVTSGHSKTLDIKRKVADVNLTFQSVTLLCGNRQAALKASHNFFQFFQESDEEESWMADKQRIAKSVITGRDLNAVLSMQKKHTALESEITARQAIIEGVIATGEELINSGHTKSSKVKRRIDELREKWNKLNEFCESRKVRLQESAAAHRYYTDANEAESWMREKMPLVCSHDYGKDAVAATTLLQKHIALQEEINAYSDDIQKLDKESAHVINSCMSYEDVGVHQPEYNINNNISIDVPDCSTEIIDIPYEVEEEQEIEKEIIKEVVQEKRYPQVRTMFKYEGHGMKIIKGETLILIEKANKDWWNVRQSTGIEGYVPANYVKEIEPKVVTKKIPKKVKVTEKRIVKKIEMRQEVVSKNSKPKLTRQSSLKRRASIHFDKDNIESRQQGIMATYKRLQKLSNARKLYLQDAIKLFEFYRECDDFEVWINDKKQLVIRKETLSGNIVSSRRKFEQFLTDISANQGRVLRLNKMADEFVETGHSKQVEVRKRQSEINSSWKQLLQLKNNKEKQLEGASTIEIYNQSAGETKEWILEKISGMNDMNPGTDLSIEDLQRKQEHLERELIPVQQNLKKLGLLATAVKSSYPDESEHIDDKQIEIKKLWQSLNNKADDRKNQFKQTRDLKRFHQDCKMAFQKNQESLHHLMDTELPKDVNRAVDLLNQNKELEHNHRINDDKVEDIITLGSSIMKVIPDSVAIKHKITRLEEERKLIQDKWTKRNCQLDSCLKLALFNREADQIDVSTNGHEAFLDFNDVSDSVDGVENLLKRHNDFEQTLLFQEERINNLKSMTQTLCENEHVSKDDILKRKNEVIQQREIVKKRSIERKNKLVEYRNFHMYVQEVDELSMWMDDKLALLSDETFKNLINLHSKLKKHEALEAELQSNKDRLDAISELGHKLLTVSNFKSDEVQVKLSTLNKKWNQLSILWQERGVKLRQAMQQKEMNDIVDNILGNITEIKRKLSSKDVGHDLSSAKRLLNYHQILENDMRINADKVKDVEKKANLLIKEGHYDAETITKKSLDVIHMFHELQIPAKTRRHSLEESLAVKQFSHDVENELQWIVEKLPQASDDDYGGNRYAAIMLLRKHDKFESELVSHQLVINKVIEKGNFMTTIHQNSCKVIEGKFSELENAWESLLKHVSGRRQQLKFANEAQKFFADADEIEEWVSEKSSLLDNQDYGRDEDATLKFIARNGALARDLESYTVTTNDLQKQASYIKKSENPYIQEVHARLEEIEEYMEDLSVRIQHRDLQLKQSMLLHEYIRESDDLSDWIGRMFQAASSEELGIDLEDIMKIKEKFEKLKTEVNVGRKKVTNCETLAAELAENNHAQTEAIQEVQLSITEDWHSLQDQLRNRSGNIEAAEEIHKFNKEADDVMSRINDKFQAIPDDCGKDLKTVQLLLRKHNTFESDLVALDSKFHSLLDDATHLQHNYPGSNAEQIAATEKVMVENWNSLKDKTLNRKDKLQHSLDYQRFLSWCRDIDLWSGEVKLEMSSIDPATEISVLEVQRNQLSEIKTEIIARQDNFSAISEAGEILLTEGHFARIDIADKLSYVSKLQTELDRTWKHKQDELDKALALQVFLRDAQQLEVMTKQQETLLTQTTIGMSVEDVDVQRKKHDAFEKVLVVQEEKKLSLERFGNELLSSDHVDAPIIQVKLQEVMAKREKVKEISNERSKQLNIAKLQREFERDLNEAKEWLQQKLKVLKDDSIKDVKDLEEKVKRLQKHQALEAEISANRTLVSQVSETGTKLMKANIREAPQVKRDLDQVRLLWQEVQETSLKRSKHLDEVKDLLQFNELVGKVQSWIKDKELMVTTGDVGDDYEHCIELQKRLDDFGADMSVDKSTLARVNDIVIRLVRKGQLEKSNIEERKVKLMNRWDMLQISLAQYRVKLAKSLEYHRFCRDVDDINEQISEKKIAMTPTELVRDLPVIEASQRKHEKMMQAVLLLDQKLKNLESHVSKFGSGQEHLHTISLDKLNEVKENLCALNELAGEHKEKLAFTYKYVKFNKEYEETNQWIINLASQFTQQDNPASVQEAENICERHKENKSEIEGREPMFQRVHELGNELFGNRFVKNDIVKEKLDKLVEEKNALYEKWEAKKNFLGNSYDLQVFNELVDQTEAWLTSKEVIIINDDIGDSVTTVEILIKKHRGIEKTLENQMEKMNELATFSKDLVNSNHDQSTIIKQKTEQVLQKRDNLLTISANRKKVLEESKQLHELMVSLYEVRSWMAEKMHIAKDESYKDLSNLQKKLLNHQAFETELESNQIRINDIVSEAEVMCNTNHFASSNIEKQMVELNNEWQDLLELSLIKGKRIKEAADVLQFERKLHDFEGWLVDVEAKLNSQEYGEDLRTATLLLKKHEMLQLNVQNHMEKKNYLEVAVEEFQETGHFLGDSILNRTEMIIESFDALDAPLKLKKQKICDQCSLYQFLADIEEEISWINDRMIKTSPFVKVDNLAIAQTLFKKHQALQTEIKGHERMIHDISTSSEHLIRGRHFASLEISSNTSKLQNLWQTLNSTAESRHKKLKESLDMHTFYAELEEARVWIHEKDEEITRKNMGKDVTAVKLILKKLNAVDLDIDSFQGTIIDLRSLCDTLVQSHHFGSEEIEAKQTNIEHQFEQLKDHAKQRRQQLEEQELIYNFYYEVAETQEWLAEKKLFASCEDLGSDLEHVEELEKRFLAFLEELNSNEERIIRIKTMAEQLVKDKVGNKAIVHSKWENVSELWKSVQELSSVRNKQLETSKMLHQFNHDADEVLNWIQEKDAGISTMDIGHDLSSVQILIKRHNGFQRELSALEEHVENVVSHAAEIVESIPEAFQDVSKKNDDVVEVWNVLLENVGKHKEMLKQMEQIQIYFTDSNELLAWISEMMTAINTHTKPYDVASAESQLVHHMENQSEIESRADHFEELSQLGREIEHNELLAEDIRNKVDQLEESWYALNTTWESKKDLFDKQLDLQMFQRDIEAAEKWLAARYPLIDDDSYLQESADIDEFFKKQEEFETMIATQEEKFKALNRLTITEEEQIKN
ncbi:spectrin beta chain, non-erythrocytic 1-like [Antedon mediterranea]|uniref:spectrin beta chain, non-erythrocytic 1-like n=1 Tax=Antedon mediterranea TaxID=105859 RepID=UPI003AF5F189